MLPLDGVPFIDLESEGKRIRRGPIAVLRTSNVDPGTQFLADEWSAISRRLFPMERVTHRGGGNSQYSVLGRPDSHRECVPSS